MTNKEILKELEFLSSLDLEDIELTREELQAYSTKVTYMENRVRELRAYSDLNWLKEQLETQEESKP